MCVCLTTDFKRFSDVSANQEGLDDQSNEYLNPGLTSQP